MTDQISYKLLGYDPDGKLVDLEFYDPFDAKAPATPRTIAVNLLEDGSIDQDDMTKRIEQAALSLYKALARRAGVMVTKPSDIARQDALDLTTVQTIDLADVVPEKIDPVIPVFTDTATVLYESAGSKTIKAEEV